MSRPDLMGSPLEQALDVDTTPPQLVIRVVDHTPVPEGSMQGFYRGGRVLIVASNRDKLKPWRKAIADAATTAARAARWTRTDGAVTIDATIWVPRPAAAGRRAWPTKRSSGDADKHLRALLDGIDDSQAVITDDSRVVDARIVKRYADGRQPGARIVVTAGVDPSTSESGAHQSSRLLVDGQNGEQQNA